MRRRWDNDERGHGVADASRLVPHGNVLLGFMAEPRWVAEEMSYVRKQQARGEITAEIATGVVSDRQFAPHGHTVRLRVSV